MILEIIAIAGASIADPLTLRQLVWMAEAKQRIAWDHTAVLLTLIANVNRDPRKGRPARPEDFHPFYRGRNRSRGIPITKGNIGVLKALLKVRPERRNE